MPQEPVSAAERQFSLMLALLMSTRGLTKHQILSLVHGYPGEISDERAFRAAERMFERDKHELKEAGFEVEAIDDPGAPGDNHLTRYRVRSPGAFSGAARLEAEDAALVRLAAGVWRDGSLSERARRASMKLLADERDAAQAMLRLDLRVRMSEPAFEPLHAAIAAGRRVEFDYLMPDRPEALRRRVEPLALLRHEGVWLLAAHDEDRDGERLFLLSRIVGGVAKGGPVDPSRAAARAGRDEIARAAARLREHESGQRAVLRTLPGSDADTRLRHRAASRGERALECRRGVVLRYADAELLADELAGFGPEVSVRAPRALREAVRARHELVLAAHGEPAGTSAAEGGEA